MITQAYAKWRINGFGCQLNGTKRDEHNGQSDGITHDDDARNVTKLRNGGVNDERDDEKYRRYEHQVRVNIQSNDLCFRIRHLLKANQGSCILFF